VVACRLSSLVTCGCYSYICDVAPRAQRTQKIGRLMSMSYFGFFVGSMTAGGLLEFHGFYVIFSAVLVLQIACCLVAVFYLKTNEQTAADRLQAENSQAVDSLVCPAAETAAKSANGGGGHLLSVVPSAAADGKGKHDGSVVGSEKRNLDAEVCDEEHIILDGLYLEF